MLATFKYELHTQMTNLKLVVTSEEIIASTQFKN